jgi:hypothetical protein
MSRIFPSRWAWAWAALTAAFALHVWDEAANDFLAFYNPIVLAARDRFGWFPMPTFTFGAWLAGLIVAITLLAALTPLLRPERRWLIWISYVYGAIHIVNALGHTAASIVLRRLAPGFLSSPVLLLAAIWLVMETNRARRSSSSRSG